MSKVGKKDIKGIGLIAGSGGAEGVGVSIEARFNPSVHYDLSW